jgi:hypothetical protein
MKYILGDGRKVRFWLDTWSGGCGLKVMFPNLFTICNQQEWTVDKVLKNGEINLTFRRGFREAEDMEWEEMREFLSRNNLTLSGGFMRSQEFSLQPRFTKNSLSLVWRMNGCGTSGRLAFL